MRTDGLGEAPPPPLIQRSRVSRYGHFSVDAKGFIFLFQRLNQQGFGRRAPLPRHMRGTQWFLRHMRGTRWDIYFISASPPPKDRPALFTGTIRTFQFQRRNQLNVSTSTYAPRLSENTFVLPNRRRHMRGIRIWSWIDGVLYTQTELSTF